jgi:6-phosphogluconolactonase
MSSVKISRPNLQVLTDADAVASRCLEIFIVEVDCVLKTKKSFNLAISGGHTPEKFFKLLGADPAAKNLPWDKLHLFWVDERYVPQDSPMSNYKLAADTFLTKVPIPKQNVHPIPTEDEDFPTAARKYAKTIRSVFGTKSGRLPRFDLIILGMGADGHTGSLFPNSSASFDTSALACPVFLLDQKLPDQTVNRITLTHPVLCAASKLLILVTGPEKAKILKEVLTNPPDEVRYPVHYLWPALDRITWLIDSPAAQLVSHQ